MVRANTLRYLIEIYKKTWKESKYGSQEEYYEFIGAAKCAYKFYYGTESEVNNRQTPYSSIKFQLRYCPAFNEQMMVKFNDRFFDVRYVETVERREVYLHCELMSEEPQFE